MTKPAKTRSTFVRLSHSDIKSTVAAQAGPRLKPTVIENKKLSNSGKASEKKKPSGKIKENGVSNGKANDAAKASSNDRINIRGQASANGKVAVKVNAFSKANSSSNRKAAVVTITNAGAKGSVKVAEEIKSSRVISKKPYSTEGKTVQTGVLKSITKPPQWRTPHTAKSDNRVKSVLNQSPPFNKPAVSGITISAPEKVKTKPTNGYTQVQS